MFFWNDEYPTYTERMAAMNAWAEEGCATISASVLSLVPNVPKGWERIEADSSVPRFDVDRGYDRSPLGHGNGIK